MWLNVFPVLECLFFSFHNIINLIIHILDVKLNVVLMGMNVVVLDNFITFNKGLKMLSDVVMSSNHWVLGWLHRDATAVL